MTQPYDFAKDAVLKAERVNMRWYHKNLTQVLENAKERQARDIHVAIGLAQQLVKKLDEKVVPPEEVPLREIAHREDGDLMKPVEQHILDKFYSSTEKGGDKEYFKERMKKSPEEKYYFRAVTSWDYGWNQKASRMLGKGEHHGRRAILKETFYRRNNVAPDPPHYAQPFTGETSICSQYSCNFS